MLKKIRIAKIIALSIFFLIIWFKYKERQEININAKNVEFTYLGIINPYDIDGCYILDTKKINNISSLIYYYNYDDNTYYSGKVSSFYFTDTELKNYKFYY